MASASARERELLEQLMQRDAQLRNKDVQLEERARLLVKTKQAIEGLQQELGKARTEEEEVKAQLSSQLEAAAARTAELEEALATSDAELRRAGEDGVAAARDARGTRDNLEKLERTLDGVHEELGAKTREIDALLREVDEARRLASQHEVAATEARRQLDEAKAMAAAAARVDGLQNARDEKDQLIRDFMSTSTSLDSEKQALLKRVAQLEDDLAAERAGRADDATAHAAKVAEARAAAEGVARQELYARLVLIGRKVDELAARERRLLAKLGEMGEQTASAKQTADSEFKRRCELERGLRDAADLFKREMWAKNEELRTLHDEVRQLREWYTRAMEGVARDLQVLKAGAAWPPPPVGGGVAVAPAEAGVPAAVAARAFSAPSAPRDDLEKELHKLRAAREDYQQAMLQQEKLRNSLLSRIQTRLDAPVASTGREGAAGTEPPAAPPPPAAEPPVAATPVPEATGIDADGGADAWRDELVGRLGGAIEALDRKLSPGGPPDERL